MIELLITLLVMGIIVSVAAPGFSSLIASNNADNAARRLASMMAYARSEAVSRANIVTLCASANGAACGANTDWNNTLLVLEGATVLKLEDISDLSTTVAVTDNNAAALAINTVCFNELGEECNGNVTYADFQFSNSGEISTTRLYRTGAFEIR